MPVVRANIETVDEIYQLVWSAVSKKQPIEAVYAVRTRPLCPLRLGRNRRSQLRVLCCQYGGRKRKRPSSDRIGANLAPWAGEAQSRETA